MTAVPGVLAGENDCCTERELQEMKWEMLQQQAREEQKALKEWEKELEKQQLILLESEKLREEYNRVLQKADEILRRHGVKE